MVLALALSSQLFLFPIACAHHTKCWLRYPMSAAYLISTAYHITESDDWLLVDRVMSRACTALLFYHYTIRYRGTYAVLLLNNVGACYTISRILHHFGSHWWVMAHMYFHAWVTWTWLVAIHV